jgi:prepilin-type N-terminal cleavage/methylation domain-containing protein
MYTWLRRLPIRRLGPLRPAESSRGVPRAGFTLVEMMVAVVILAIGLLGLASTAAVVTRQISGGAAQSIAANVVQSRVESLRSLSCAAIEDGSAVTRGVSERWVRGDTANRTLPVEHTVEYSVGGTRRTLVDTVRVPC